MAEILLEACIDSVASGRAAERGGAGRVELCDALYDGGTTPSAGMIAATVAALRIPVYVILRCRGGDFVYSDDEMDVMRRDARVARECGAAGVVVGVLRPDATVDPERTRALMDAAGLPATFHRAFDLVADQARALDTLIALGIERVLTSGGAASALVGADAIGELVTRSAGRVAIMAGGGIREDNVAEVVRRSSVREVHVRGTKIVQGVPRILNVRFRKPLMPDEDAWDETDETRITAVLLLARRAEAIEPPHD